MSKYLYLLLCLLLCCNCNNEKEPDIIVKRLSLSCNNLILNWTNSKSKVTINAHTHWIIQSEIPSWISIDITEGDKGTTTATIEASDNLNGKNRSCSIIFTTDEQEQILYITQKTKEILYFKGKKRYTLSSEPTTLDIAIEQNISYDIKILKTEDYEWIKQTNEEESNGDPNSIATNNPTQNNIHLDIEENLLTETRFANIVIFNKDLLLSDTLYIEQNIGKGRHYDGEYFQLQQASIGKGVNIIIMGDGFTRQDMALNGRYETIMKQTADYFLSIEPYNSYRDYFNIYMIVVESEEAGVGTKNSFGGTVNNKFGTAYGNGTEITCNADLCLKYAHKVKELPTNMPITVIISLNSTKYAGTTYLYSNGNSIALCPMSTEIPPNDFEGLIHHEAGGHGFGFLCDEYVYYKQEMPESRKRDLKEWQKLGFQMNLDFTDDPSSILWKDFIGIEKYHQVGAYEGGYEYQYGVWRSEANSCMNNNIPYFNVQSRWSIVSRIMKLAGVKDFTIQDFINSDHSTFWNETITRRKISDIKKFPPLGCPKWIKH